MEFSCFERRIHYLFGKLVNAVSFVDEKNFVRLHVGKNSSDVAGFLKSRSGSGPDIYAHFFSYKVSESGFAQTRLAVEENVVADFFPLLSGPHYQPEVFFGLFLTDVIVPSIGPESEFQLRQVVIIQLVGFFLGHFEAIDIFLVLCYLQRQNGLASFLK